jgi:murein DD-endopeptidase MepM/ murein hydrolase activator NlpD
MGSLCVVQNFVDMAPGEEARDQTCGPLTYDGHDGVDIRVPSLVEMRQGVAVVAAAPGVVKAIRDEMADVSVREIGAAALKGRDAGNGVVIDHGDGWETQYSHLRRGSVAVRKGERVETGQRLGLIGLSGNTEFPHLHFSVRHDGEELDPYTGRAPESGCGEPGESLWTAETAVALAYRAGGLLMAGFADAPPEMDALMDGAQRSGSLPADSPALVFWAVAWGLRGGDQQTIRLLGPGGAVIAESETAVPRDKAQWLGFAGRKRSGEAWPAGLYRGTYVVTRQESGVTQTVIAREQLLEVR